MTDYLAEAIARRQRVTGGTSVKQQKQQNILRKKLSLGEPVSVNDTDALNKLGIATPTVSTEGAYTLGDRGRTWDEAGSDAAIGVQISGNRMVQSANAMGAIATAGELADATQSSILPDSVRQQMQQETGITPVEVEPNVVGEALQDTGKILNDWFQGNIAGDQADIDALLTGYSDPTKLAKQRDEEASQERTANQPTDMGILDYAGDFASAVGDYIDNPLAALAGATESSGDILMSMTGGGLISALTKKGLTKAVIDSMTEVALKKKVKKLGLDISDSQLAVLKGVTQKQTTKTAIKATEDLAKRRAIVFGNATTGIQEGGSNANQAYAEVMAMSHDDLLKKSEPYRKLLSEKVEPVEAQKQLANQAMAATGVSSGLAAIGIGKLSGATEAKSLAAAGIKKTGVIAGAIETGKAAAREGIEEVFQSGSGQALSNIAIQQTADETKNVMEGVTDAAAAGLASGALMGGAIPATGTVVKEIIAPLTKNSIMYSGEKLSKGKQALGDTIHKIKVARTDPEIQAALTEFNAELDTAEKEAFGESPNVDTVLDASAKITSLSNSLNLKIDANNNEIEQLKEDLTQGDLTPEDTKQVKTDLALRVKENKVLNAELDNSMVRANALTDKAIELFNSPEEVIKSLTSPDKANYQQAAKQLEQLISLNPQSISAEQADAIVAADLDNQLSPLIKTVLANVSVDRLNNAKDSVVAVAKDKVIGSEGFSGLRQYRDSVYKALLTDNPVALTQLLDTLGRWVETDTTRTSTILKAMQGDPAALKLAEARYKKTKFAAVTAEAMANENTLIRDVYNNLRNLVNDASPELAQELKYPEFSPLDLTTEAAPKAPKTVKKGNGSNTPTKGSNVTVAALERLPENYGRTDATNATNERIANLPEGYDSDVAVGKVGKQGTWFFTVLNKKGNKVLRKLGAPAEKAVQNFISTNWTEGQITRLNKAGITPEKMQSKWNTMVSPTSTDTEFKKAVTYLNNVHVAINKMLAAKPTPKKENVKPTVKVESKEEVTPTPDVTDPTLAVEPEKSPQVLHEKVDLKSRVKRLLTKGVADLEEELIGYSVEDKYDLPEMITKVKKVLESKSLNTSLAQALKDEGIPLGDLVAFAKENPFGDGSKWNARLLKELGDFADSQADTGQAEMFSRDVGATLTSKPTSEKATEVEPVTPTPEPEMVTEIVDETGTVLDGVNKKEEYVEPELKTELMERQSTLASLNMITAYFKMHSPLNTVRNFFAKAADNDYQLIKDNLPKDFFNSSTVEGDVTGIWGEAQSAAVDKFLQFKNLFHGKIQSSVEAELAKTLNQSHKNFASDLLDDNGKLDVNVLDALALGIYKWVNTEASGTLFTNEKSIKRKLGLDSKNFLPKGAHVLFTAGVSQDEIITSLGSLVYGALGFTANKNIDKAAKAKLESSLGQVAMKMAMDQGVIIENTNVVIGNEVHEAWKGNTVEHTHDLKFFKVINYIPAKNELPKIAKVLQEYIDVEQESGKVMTSFLDKDNLTKQPFFSRKAVLKHVPKGMKGTLQLITKPLAQIIEKHMKRAYQVKQNMHTIHSTMSREQKAALLGYVGEAELAALPFYVRETTRAKNEDIVRSIKNYEDFIKSVEVRGHGLESFIYFPHEVWRNLRMGMVSSIVNPQASKYDRHLMGLTADVSEFNIGSSNRKHTDFLLAVALGMGVSVDKKQVSTSLDAFNTVLQNPIVQKGLKSVQELQKDPSQAEQLNNNIIAAVNELGEAMHSYEALVAYAEYLTAKDLNQKTFTTSLTAETDGVTNGPALATFLMGGVSASADTLKGLLEAAGFKFKGMIQDHGEWKDLGNKDLYEQTSALITTAMEMSTIPYSAKQALAYFVGAYEIDPDTQVGEMVDTPRDLPKEVVTGSSYGQGEMSVKRYAGGYGINKVQAAMFAGGKAGWLANKGRVAEILNWYMDSQINAPKNEKRKGFLSQQKDKLIDSFNNTTYDTFFETGLSKDLTEVIAEAYQASYGEMLNTAIGVNFAGLQKTAKIVGGLSNVMFTVYSTKLNEAIEAKKVELEENSPTTFNSAIDDLPTNVYNEVVESVKEFLPVFDNVYSQESGDLVNNGIRIGKSRKAKAVDDKGHGRSSHTVEGLMGKVNITETLEENPGISAVAAMVHSIDATIMYRTLKDNAVTNIFDAILTGVNNISKGSRSLNKATFDTISELNPLDNVYQRFMSVVGELTQDMVNSLSEPEFEALGMSLVNTIIATDVAVTTIPDSVLNGLDKMVNPFNKDKPLFTKDALAEVGIWVKSTDSIPLQYVVTPTAFKQVMLQVLKVDSASVVSLVQAGSKAAAEQSVQVKNELLKDLTYVSQYNKEGDGAIITNGSVSFHKEGTKESIEQDTAKLIADMGNIDLWEEDAAPWGIEPETTDEFVGKAEFELSSFDYIYRALMKSDPLWKSHLEGMKADLLAGNALDFSALDAEGTTYIKKHLRTLSPSGFPTAMYPDSVVTTAAELNNEKYLTKNMVDGVVQGKEAVIKLLKGLSVRQGKDQTKIRNFLVNGVLKILPANTSIQLVTDANYADVVKGKSPEFIASLAGSKGMFDPNTNVVYLRSTEDTFNGMSIEVITHELIHAAVATVDGIVGDLATPAVLLLRSQMDKLVAMARKFDTAGEWDSALCNRGELLAWGLTNTEFQKWLQNQKLKTKATLFQVLARQLRNFFKIGESDHTLFTELLDATKIYVENAGQFTPKQQATTNNYQSHRADPISRDIYVDSLNAVEVFDSLEVRNHVPVAKTHQNHLRDVMGTMFSKAIQPIKMTHQMNNTATMGQTLNNRVTLSTFDPTATAPSVGMVQNGFNASAQEVYVNEMLNVLLQDVSGDSSLMGQRINKLFKLAQSTVKPEDLRVLGSESDADLMVKWKSVFEATEDSEGKIHHLREFLAMAQTNEVLRKALEPIKVPTNFVNTEGKTFLQKVQIIFGMLLDMVFSKYSNIPRGNTALTQLEAIAQNITQQEDKGKNIIFVAMDVPLTASTEIANRAIKLVRDSMMLIAGDTQNNPVTVVAKTLGDTYDNRGANIGKAATIIGNKIIGKGRLGFNGMLLNETMGEVDTPSSVTNSFNNTKIHSLLRKFKTVIDKVGQENKAGIITELRNAFGKTLNVKQLAALTNAVLRADMRALINHGMTLPHIISMLDNTAILNAEIKKVKAQLKQHVANIDTFQYYINGSRAMGVSMIKGINTEAITTSNPQRIMDMDGIKEYTTVHPEQSGAALELIDTLGSLYALRALEPSEAKLAADVMINQGHKTDNGINFLLSMSTAMQEEAKASQFADAPKNFVKGYVPDATDSTKATEISDNKNDVELIRKGFKFKAALRGDPRDAKSTVKYLYVKGNSGAGAYVQGVAYINENSSRGHSLYKTRMNSQNGIVAMEAHQEFADILAAKRSDVLSMLRRKSNAKKGVNYMGASFDDAGNISDFKYTTSGALKDKYLNRNNDAFLAMGNMANMNHVVPKTKEANKTLIDVLKTQYEEDKANGNLSRYILLNQTSTDKNVRDAYRLLPKDTRDYIKGVFGEKGLPIRNDLFNVVIGQRKWGIAEIWNQNWEEDNNRYKYLTAKVINTLTVNTGKYWLPNVERGLKEVVSKTKDIIINLSGTVLMANTASNTNYLVCRGLSTRDALKLQAEALDAAKQYIGLNQRKIALEYRIKGNYKPSEHVKYRSELQEIKGLMSNNKAADMIKAGLLPTIAEEQDTTEESTNSYGARLSNWIDDKAGKNSAIRAVAHNVAFTKDTEVYKAISSMTQLSDFSSKYALIHYLTTREKNKLSTEQAYAEATRAFVNYDLPTHQLLQYAGDLGLLWFPRYAVRIQRTILDSIADNPARVLALLSINLMTGGILPTIYQSLMGVAYNPANLVGFLDRLAGGIMLHPTLRPF